MQDLEFKVGGKWVDAYATFGLKMNTSFIPNLLAPRPLKKNIENVSRMQHGKRVIVGNRKYDSRDISLNVVIWGDNNESYRQKRKALLEFLESGEIEMRLTERSDEVFRLVYLDSSSYSEDYWGTYGSMAIKFCESNPNNRRTQKPAES